MNTLEQAILGPIRSELIGHTATFYSICGKTVAENITDIELRRSLIHFTYGSSTLTSAIVTTQIRVIPVSVERSLI